MTSKTPLLSYHYRELPPGHIRLLKIHGTEARDDICCSLVDHDLSTKKWKRSRREDDVFPNVPQDPEYTAVSYTWLPDSQADTGPRQSSITLDGKSVQVQSNLWCFLYSIGQKQTQSLYWIDALCIDQQDEKDKERQLPMMGSIYRSAARVLVWLGNATRTSNIIRHQMLFRKLNEFGPDEGYTNARSKNFLIKADMERLIQIMDRAYWTRSWIVQEIGVASYIEVYCGEVGVSWTRLSHLRRHFQQFLEHKRAHNDKGIPLEHALLKALNENFKRLDETRETHFKNMLLGILVSMEELLSLHASTECREPRDKIYSLMHLVRDGVSANSIIKSYEAPMVEVVYSVLQDWTTRPSRDARTLARYAEQLQSLFDINFQDAVRWMAIRRPNSIMRFQAEAYLIGQVTHICVLDQKVFRNTFRTASYEFHDLARRTSFPSINKGRQWQDIRTVVQNRLRIDIISKKHPAHNVLFKQFGQWFVDYLDKQAESGHYVNFQNYPFTAVMTKWSEDLRRFGQLAEMADFDDIHSFRSSSVQLEPWVASEASQSSDTVPWRPDDHLVKSNQSNLICVACVNSNEFTIVSQDTKVGETVCGFKDVRTIAVLHGVSKLNGACQPSILSRGIMSMFVDGIRPATLSNVRPTQKLAFRLDLPTLLFLSQDLGKQLGDRWARAPMTS